METRTTVGWQWIQSHNRYSLHTKMVPLDLRQWFNLINIVIFSFFFFRCEKLCDLIWITRSHVKEAEHFRTTLSYYDRYFELQQSSVIINTLLDMTVQYLSSLIAR